MAALRRLPAAQREAIALHHLADLPVAEVASTLQEKAPLLTSDDGGYTWTETPLPGPSSG